MGDMMNTAHWSKNYLVIIKYNENFISGRIIQFTNNSFYSNFNLYIQLLGTFTCIASACTWRLKRIRNWIYSASNRILHLSTRLVSNRIDLRLHLTPIPPPDTHKALYPIPSLRHSWNQQPSEEGRTKEDMYGFRFFSFRNTVTYIKFSIQFPRQRWTFSEKKIRIKLNSIQFE